MNKLVYFRDTLEDNAEEHYGILLEDETILCLCCMGIVEKGDYEILDDEIDTYYSLDTIIKREME